MATTVPADMTVEQWDDQYFEDFVNKDWWKKFSGSGADNMICVKEDLVDKPGNAWGDTYTEIQVVIAEVGNAFLATKGSAMTAGAAI